MCSPKCTVSEGEIPPCGNPGQMPGFGNFPRYPCTFLMTKTEGERAQAVAKFKQWDIIAAVSSMDGLLPMFG